MKCWTEYWWRSKQQSKQLIKNENKFIAYAKEALGSKCVGIVLSSIALHGSKSKRQKQSKCLLKQFHIYILTFLVWVHKSCLIFKDIDIKG